MSTKRLIISDVHLGMPGYAEPQQLRTLWRGFDELVVNGDLVEMHHPVYRAKAGWQLVELRSLAEHDGIELTLISGNHDPYLAERRHLVMAGGQVFATHGDVLHPSIAPWCPTSNQVQEEYFTTEAALAPASRMNLETRLEITAHAAHISWQKHIRGEGLGRTTTLLSLLARPYHIARLLHYWAIVPKLAARFAAEHSPDAQFVLTGHTHRQGVWRIGERVVINTGCFTYPGKPLGVVVDDETLAVHRIRKRGNGYHLDDQPIKAFKLAPFDSNETPVAGAREPLLKITA